MDVRDSAQSSSPARPPRPRLTPAELGLILVLAAVQFTHIVDFVIIMPLGDRLMTELELNPSQFAWVISAYGISAAVAGVLAAAVMDRFDRKAVILTMYAGFAASTLYCGLAESYYALLVARALAGMFGGLSAAAIMAIIGDVFPPAKRATATGAVMSAFAVASIAGLPVGLGLANWLGWGTPFVALAWVSGAVWVVAWRRLPSFRGHMTGDHKNPFREFADVLSIRQHWVAFAWTWVLVHGTFTIIPFLGPYMEANVGRSRQDLLVVYGVAGVFTLVSMNVIGRLADRYGKRLVFRLTACLALAATVAFTNLPPVPLAVAVLMAAAFMVFASGRMVPAQAMMIGAAAPQVRGAFLTLNGAVQHTAVGVAPMISGAIMERGAGGKLVGYPAVGLVAAGFAVASLVIAEYVRPAPGDTAVGPLPRPTAEPEAVAVG